MNRYRLVSAGRTVGTILAASVADALAPFLAAPAGTDLRAYRVTVVPSRAR